MIETVFALLMFVNGEIKEHLIQDSMRCAYVESVQQKDSTVNLYLINVIKVKLKLKYIMAEKTLEL